MVWPTHAEHAIRRIKLHVAATRTLQMRRGDITQGLLIGRALVLVASKPRICCTRGEVFDPAYSAKTGKLIGPSLGVVLIKLTADHYSAATEQLPGFALVKAKFTREVLTNTCYGRTFGNFPVEQYLIIGHLLSLTWLRLTYPVVLRNAATGSRVLALRLPVTAVHSV